MAANPPNMAAGQKRFAYRHKAADTRRGRCRLWGSDQTDPGRRKQRCGRDRRPADGRGQDEDSVSYR